ncbi:hypothetical protein HMPREF0591_1463 [Mycobacterium parascrofulaceum ATCC BAA-614]|uniref:Uncharacterized protein n=1 Tax=Mycobacterium parascrofulaceum ATCC BAA-614 TaxID=525368 RepID=D5P5L9_9MYCO|nr:hypothetical protein [Mycobacterium parascrofulaceum]EFG78632.1 hypothetical protein HMPREF0591_1463 [Mycobacterium parascrofulaceum ATCC BAA-614]
MITPISTVFRAANTFRSVTSSLLVVLAVQKVLGGRRVGAWQPITVARWCGAGFVAFDANLMDYALHQRIRVEF